jgi:hypothetical protein
MQDADYIGEGFGSHKDRFNARPAVHYAHACAMKCWAQHSKLCKTDCDHAQPYFAFADCDGCNAEHLRLVIGSRPFSSQRAAHKSITSARTLCAQTPNVPAGQYAGRVTLTTTSTREHSPADSIYLVQDATEPCVNSELQCCRTMRLCFKLHIRSNELSRGQHRRYQTCIRGRSRQRPRRQSLASAVERTTSCTLEPCACPSSGDSADSFQGYCVATTCHKRPEWRSTKRRARSARSGSQC